MVASRAAPKVALLGGAAYPAWRSTRVFSDVPRGMVERPSGLAELVARVGLRPSAVTGVRMAIERGRGRSSVPTRAALAGTSLSVVALVTAFTYGQSFQRLLDTPRLYGWNWDALVGDFFFEDLSERVEPVLRQSPSIAGYSAIAGFVRSQVRGTVVWQATTMAVFALAVGIPLGVAAGRWSWRAFAHELGIVPEPVVPLLTVGLIVAAAIAVANGAAMVPARVAARTRPARVLRSE